MFRDEAVAHALEHGEAFTVTETAKLWPAAKRCSTCGRRGHDKRGCLRVAPGRQFDPWNDLEWEEHDEARDVVNEHPDGMTLEEVGAVLGVTRERVRQIEAAALEKLKTGLGLGEAVMYGAATIPIQECDRCGLPFMRRGRVKTCETCASPKKSKTKKKPPAHPRIKIVRAPEVVASMVESDPKVELPTPDRILFRFSLEW